MSVLFYRDSSQVVLKHDRVATPNDGPGVITDLYGLLATPGADPADDLVYRATVQLDAGGVGVYDVSELSHLPPEKELALRLADELELEPLNIGTRRAERLACLDLAIQAMAPFDNSVPWQLREYLETAGQMADGFLAWLDGA